MKGPVDINRLNDEEIQHMIQRLCFRIELLSLIGKLGFLYVQDFHDAAATSAVNDLEGLTTGLSRRIWQKIMMNQI